MMNLQGTDIVIGIHSSREIEPNRPGWSIVFPSNYIIEIIEANRI